MKKLDLATILGLTAILLTLLVVIIQAMSDHRTRIEHLEIQGQVQEKIQNFLHQDIDRELKGIKEELDAHK